MVTRELVRRQGVRTSTWAHLDAACARLGLWELR
jgi:hypothetical protein